MLRLIVFCTFLNVFTVFANKDSTRWDFRMKGIDIAIGASTINIKQPLLKTFVSSLTPPNTYYSFDYSSIKIGNKQDSNRTYFPSESIQPVKVMLSTVFSNDKSLHMRFLQRTEFGFYLGIEIGNMNLYYQGVKIDKWSKSEVQGRIEMRYQLQHIGFLYQVVSKPIFKNFALYSGLRSDYGLLSLKSNDHTTKIENSPFGGTTYLHLSTLFGTVGLETFLGLKYNLACDLNLFIQHNQGYRFYAGKHNVVNSLNGFCIGMRYKIIDEQDRPNYLNSGFW